MTIRHLEIFRAVCHCGGITKAADALNMTQPAVSVAIRELEAFYSAKLFDRMNRRVIITEPGKQLLQYAENILSQYEEAALVLRHGPMAFRCRLGVNVSFAESHASQLVSHIRRTFPDCDLHITIGNNEALRRMLADNEIDFAVYDGFSQKTGANEIFLFDEEMVLLCTDGVYPGEVISISELSNLPLLLRERGSGVRTCIDAAFAEHALTPHAVTEGCSTLGLLSLAASALGCVFVPLSLADTVSRFYPSLHTVGLRDTEIRRIYHLAYNGHKYLTQPMQSLRKQITLLYQKNELPQNRL